MSRSSWTSWSSQNICLSYGFLQWDWPYYIAGRYDHTRPYILATWSRQKGVLSFFFLISSLKRHSLIDPTNFKFWPSSLDLNKFVSHQTWPLELWPSHFGTYHPKQINLLIWNVNKWTFTRDWCDIPGQILLFLKLIPFLHIYRHFSFWFKAKSVGNFTKMRQKTTSSPQLSTILVDDVTSTWSGVRGKYLPWPTVTDAKNEAPLCFPPKQIQAPRPFLSLSWSMITLTHKKFGPTGWSESHQNPVRMTRFWQGNGQNLGSVH